MAISNGESGSSVRTKLNASLAKTDQITVTQPVDLDTVEAQAAAALPVTLTSPANDDIIQRKAGSWVNRTIAQLITDLTSGLSALFGLKTGFTMGGFLTFNRGANIAAANPTNVSAPTGNSINITGSGATIDSFGSLADGAFVWAKFDGINTISSNSNILTPNSSPITTAADDWVLLYGNGGGVVTVVTYLRKVGVAENTANKNVNGGYVGRDANGNATLNNFIQGYATTATAAGTTTLVVGSVQIQVFTGSTTQTVVLPVVSTLALGQSYYFINNSSGIVTIKSSGSNDVVAIPAGQQVEVKCILLTGTSAASWQIGIVPNETNLAAWMTDVTTGNASTTKHGFLKKLDNDGTHYMDGQGNWTVPAGSGGGGITGTLNVNTTAVGNVGAGTDDLITYSVPAGTLGANTDYLTFEMSGTVANNVNAKTLTVVFGSTTLISISVPISAAADWSLTGAIIRTGATTFKSRVVFNSNSATLMSSADYIPGTETLANALTLKCTGAATADNDIVQESLIVRLNSTSTDLSAYASLTGTQTLTNKRITPRIGTEASSSTPTPTGDSVDMWTETALAANATFAAPTGTPTEGQRLIIRIKDNGTARTLAWNAIYRASTDLPLPTTTVISKTMYVGFIYNSTDSKWDLLSLLNNF